MGVNVTVQVVTSAVVTQSKLGNFTGRPQIDYYRQLPNQYGKCYPAALTADASLDVTALTDAYGNALSFTNVEIVQVKNNDDTDTITVSGDLIGSDVATVGPGKCLYLDTTRAVTGASKTLTFTRSGGTPGFDVILIGT